MARVDPRGCGGAAAPSRDGDGHKGRSPRVRGSPQPLCGIGVDLGSIPAGAGEPRLLRDAAREQMVDPRGCGGAPLPDRARSSSTGRSPRVRGSLTSLDGGIWRKGSIPAGAGEPCSRTAPSRSSRVDPRGCGGATTPSSCLSSRSGRSPRVRGSRHRRAPRGWRPRSIPAGAGEPGGVGRPSRQIRVDPRGCGGAKPMPCKAIQVAGRSPRVRGSLPLGLMQPLSPRSIPAGAGEPLGLQDTQRPRRVDPRGCGGARIGGRVSTA